MKKRIFAGLLALMMMLSVIPVTEVSATSVSGNNAPTVSGPNVDETDTKEPEQKTTTDETKLKLTSGTPAPVDTVIDTEAELVAAIATGGEITLGGDITVNGSITINNKITLDLNGWSITGTDNETKSYGLININPGSELTINDSSEDKTGKITLKATNNRNWNFYSSVISNQRGKLIVEGGTIEHLGGTDMAYGIDNLTNGKNTYAETIINGGTVKSPYRAIRQFLNGIEAQNILTVNGGTIEGANKSIWMQDPSAGANSGTLTVEKEATLIGDVNLTVTAGSTEWPVNVSVATAALADGYDVLSSNVPGDYHVVEIDGTYCVKHGAAKIGNKYYETLQQAFDEVKDGTSEVIVELLADDTLAETNINCPMTLKGNGYTVTGTGKKMFRNFATATYEDVTIVNETHEGRCIETRSGNMDLYLRNTTLKTTSTGNNQPLTVGGSGKEIYVLLDKSMIDAGVAGYGITTFNPVTINIMEQSEVTGYAALYFKPADGSEGSKGTEVYVYGGSKLSSQNGHSGQLENKNGFATVVFEDNGITFDADSTVSLSAVTNGTPEASQAIFGIKENITDINIYAEAAKVSAKDVLSGSDLSHEHHISLPSGYEDEIECSHSKESVFTGAWDATCTEDGNTGDYICEYCGKITTPGTVIPATGHDFDKDGVCKNGCGTVLILEEDAKVEVQIQPEYVSGDVSETITSEEEKEIADFVANNIIVENMDAMVESVTAVGNEAAKDETLHAKAEAALTPAENEEVIVVIKPYLQSEIKAVDVDAAENKALVSIEMNLVYDVVAKIDKESAEEVTLESGKKVENPKPMDISFAIPGELIDAKALKESGKVLYIEHPKADGSVYYHEASIEEFEIEESDGTKRYYDVITFHNDKGFSEFNLMIGDEVPADKVVSTSAPAPTPTIAMYAATGEYIEVSSVSENIIEEGKDELKALIGDSYGKYRLALAADLHADLKGSTKIKILVDDVTAADAVIILHKGADGWEAISNKAGDGYVIGKFSSLSPVLVFVDEDGELEAAQNATSVTTVPAGSTTPAPTGDSSMTVLWIGVLAIAAMAVVCTFVYNKKRRA